MAVDPESGAELIRPLGHIEVYSSSRHALGLYRGIVNCCRYVVPKTVFQAAPVQQLLEDALARTILRLSSLRVGILHHDTNEPHFIHIPKINLQEMIEWKRLPQTSARDAAFDKGLLAIIEGRLDQVWTEMTIRPPWKLIVVQQGLGGDDDDSVVLELIYATHHSLCDGKSSAVVHTVLLEELNRASAPPPELQNHILPLHKAAILAPSQEELVTFKISWLFFFCCLWEEFGPAWLKGTPPVTPWAGKPYALEPHDVHIRMVTIPPSALSAVLAACRAHKATLTTLVHALVLSSISHRVPADVAQAFRGATAISLQRYAKFPPGEEIDLSKIMTDMSTATHHAFGPDVVAELRKRKSNMQTSAEDLESRIWRVATTLRAELKEKLDTLPNDDVTGLLAWVSDWRQRWLNKIGQPREDTWVLSNIGSFQPNTTIAEGEDNGRSANWRIERSIFTQPALLVGPTFAVNISGVSGGPVTICLNWQEEIVDADIVDGIATDLETWIESFEKTGRFWIFN